MPPQKQKFLFYLPSLVFFIWLYFFLANIIKSTLSYDPYKDNSINQVSFSYKIESSNNEVISKLSRKFDISNEKETVPQLIKNAFISAEDKRFLKHHGIDILGLIRASLINLKNGSIVEGGSTITQQASRLIFLNNELSFFRKIKEILISLIMDLRFSKNQILKIYLNKIYLGSGANGINEAAKIYFGKFIHELTLSEVALLAGLTPAPSIYSPYKNYDLAIQNRNKVLNSLYKNGFINKTELYESTKEKIKLNQKSSEINLEDDKLLINFILEEAIKKFKLNYDLKLDDYIVIKSSLFMQWQKEAQKLASNIKPKDIEVALISIESNSGLIRAFVSGRSPLVNEFNRVINAIRPLGSTFKIIPYIGILSIGKNINDFYYDEPTCWDGYCPRNFSQKYRGKISLIDSFKYSSNIVPIKISKEIGLKNIINLANLFGLGYKQKFDEVLPLAIGAYGDSLLNISNAYSAINNDGKIIKPEIIEKIEFNNEKIIWLNKPIEKRIMSKKVINNINKLLEKSITEGNGIAAAINSERVFGKTGTSDNYRDLWFIGSIKNTTTGIWIGFDDNRKTILSSGDAASFWKIYKTKSLLSK